MPLPSTILYPSGGGGGGAGDVVGPASSTDNAIARYDGTTGKLLQDSSVLVPDGLSGTVVIGSTGATDLGIIVANGTGGSTVQASAATLTTAGSLTIPNGQSIKTPMLISSAAGAIDIIAASIPGTAQFRFYVSAGPYLVSSSTGGYYWSSGAANGSVDTSWRRSSAGVIQAADGGGGIGALITARSVEANTAGSGTPNALTATESWKVLTNEGATAANYHTLPTAVAGYNYTFVVQDADGLRVTASASDTIRVIDKVTAAAGYIESTTIGSTVTLVAINATEWFATSIKGVWTDGTWSYDDTSLTTP